MISTNGARLTRTRTVPFVLVAMLAGTTQAQQLLFENGPVRTGVGDGVGGVDTSAVQVASGQTITGYGAGSSGDHRLADDFLVPSPGWRLRGVRVLAFQRGAEATSTTISGLNLRIWDGPPGAPASNVVFGDAETDRLSSSSFAGIYRVMGARIGDDSAPVFDAFAGNVSLVLEPGSYWLDWQLAGTRASGPLVPPVTRAGEVGEGNAQQSRAGVWYAISGLGGAGQELPFALSGAVLEFEGQLFSDSFEGAP
jgi:hypothetical protein